MTARWGDDPCTISNCPYREGTGCIMYMSYNLQPSLCSTVSGCTHPNSSTVTYSHLLSHPGCTYSHLLSHPGCTYSHPGSTTLLSPPHSSTVTYSHLLHTCTLPLNMKHYSWCHNTQDFKMFQFTK